MYSFIQTRFKIDVVYSEYLRFVGEEAGDKIIRLYTIS